MKRSIIPALMIFLMPLAEDAPLVIPVKPGEERFKVTFRFTDEIDKEMVSVLVRIPRDQAGVTDGASAELVLAEENRTILRARLGSPGDGKEFQYYFSIRREDIRRASVRFETDITGQWTYRMDLRDFHDR